MHVRSCRWAALILTALAPALAQDHVGPHWVSPPPAIATPQDISYPATLTLSVDATDLDRRIFRVKETIPVSESGPLTLLYPRWLPGDHSPTGPLDLMTGLVITAAGKRVEWVRDTVEMSAFHVNLPVGTRLLDLEFQFSSPTEEKVGRVVVTPEMLNLQWNAVVFYPAGFYASRIMVEANVKLPTGWKYATALDATSSAGGVTAFKSVSLETLVDSPMFAGKYFKQLDLDPGAAVPVRLTVVADKASSLEVKPEALAAHRALVQQAYKLYGARHYDHYDFLLALTDNLGDIGLEHHRSSENSLDPSLFTDWDKSFVERDLLPHEFTHSWNGKFRRPADLWTPNYNVPMRDSLLWVYEGQTQYWGYVLAARSGLMTKQQTLEAIADIAAYHDATIGRSWRALQDTTNDPIVAARRSQSWRQWQRSEDYYSEGQLIWLEIDTLIREQTKGAKSLDDFAQAFFGINDGSFTPVTYTFDDAIQTLNRILPHDWATFLRARLDGHGPGAPLDGLRRGGYSLVFTDKQTEFGKSIETQYKRSGFAYSLGFTANKDGVLTAVTWDGPAFKAGLTTGVKLIAVNGKEYDADDLNEAIVQAAQPDALAIEILVKNGHQYRTLSIPYHGGLRYPHLERIEGAPALLDDILAPKP